MASIGAVTGPYGPWQQTTDWYGIALRTRSKKFDATAARSIEATVEIELQEKIDTAVSKSFNKLWMQENIYGFSTFHYNEKNLHDRRTRKQRNFRQNMQRISGY